MRLVRMEFNESDQVVLTMMPDGVAEMDTYLAPKPEHHRPLTKVNVLINDALEEAADDLGSLKEGLDKINPNYDCFSLEQTAAFRLVCRHEAIVAGVPDLEDELFDMYGGWERAVFIDAVDAILSGEWRQTLGWSRLPASNRSVRIKPENAGSSR